MIKKQTKRPVDANATFDEDELKWLNISDEEADCVTLHVGLGEGKHGKYVAFWRSGENEEKV